MKYRYLFTIQLEKGLEESKVMEYDEKPSCWILDSDFEEWFDDKLSQKGIKGFYEEL